MFLIICWNVTISVILLTTRLHLEIHGASGPAWYSFNLCSISQQKVAPHKPAKGQVERKIGGQAKPVIQPRRPASSLHRMQVLLRPSFLPADAVFKHNSTPCSKPETCPCSHQHARPSQQQSHAAPYSIVVLVEQCSYAQFVELRALRGVPPVMAVAAVEDVWRSSARVRKVERHGLRRLLYGSASREYFCESVCQLTTYHARHPSVYNTRWCRSMTSARGIAQ